jgi:hypothetical protein
LNTQVNAEDTRRVSEDLRRLPKANARGALERFEESLAICRRILEAYGETPERKRDVALSLIRCSGRYPQPWLERPEACRMIAEAAAILGRLARSQALEPRYAQEFAEVKTLFTPREFRRLQRGENPCA